MIVKYAKIIGRTPSALNMKIGNLGRLDPKLKERGIVGLTHGAKMEQEVWKDFYDNPDKLAYESECLIAKYTKNDMEKAANVDIDHLPEGKERLAIVKQRVNQSFFRSAVMCSYDFKCCISGVGNSELLEACHILDWSEDKNNRSNPENGLCLNSLFHKAYDKYLIAITPDYKIIVSDEMIEKTEDESFKCYLLGLQNKKLILPNRFYPKPDFLDYHYQKYLSK
ncbi:HNH endonuclease [Hoylesella buccalis]|uniref:HNH endonuclease n=1 Tax=Hoylesella buccalis TaxID=28127 RepID=UPI001D148756|nr:HNH endonuclease [Hoylesella buccalis]UEA62078.1 HNH endonuclease [Hoylesella buccalis]UWP50639.1 HNH endonuclease [Hoylesella buccalis ATCC 35310]